MKCDELKPIELECNMGKDVNGVEHHEPWKAYDIDEVDAFIAKKDKEIAELNAKLDKAIAERDGNQVCIDALKAKLGVVNELVKESKELLKESQRMHQRCADNASKQIRRLRRALYKACANWANVTRIWDGSIPADDYDKWYNVERKCLKKAEEYK